MLRAGDVLTHVGGQAIADDGTFLYEQSVRIDFRHLPSMAFDGDHLQVRGHWGRGWGWALGVGLELGMGGESMSEHHLTHCTNQHSAVFCVAKRLLGEAALAARTAGLD